MIDKLGDLRTEYNKDGLRRNTVFINPFEQFEKWFKQTLEAEIDEPNAMVLSTVGADGMPDSRIVLLKELDSEGFVFYTNYRSKKGQDIKVNPGAAINFFWKELERQVRIKGEVVRVAPEESDAYFAGRPRGSQLGAWASHQSELIPNRESLENRLETFSDEFDGREIPRPKYWGGFRLIPNYFEFWQGRPNRLHDRVTYRLESPGTWKIKRLSP